MNSKREHAIVEMAVKQKTFEQIKQHFEERLLQRYGLQLDVNYRDLDKRYKGVYKKTQHKSIGHVTIKGVKVWCLYDNDSGLMTTAYPPAIENDVYECIRACFAFFLQPLAVHLYHQYEAEKSALKFDFETAKDAAIFYFQNTCFPTLHIDYYKFNEVGIFKIMHQLKKVLECSSPHITLKVQRLEKENV